LDAIGRGMPLSDWEYRRMRGRGLSRAAVDTAVNDLVSCGLIAVAVEFGRVELRRVEGDANG
jgi:hypothetical protein